MSFSQEVKDFLAGYAAVSEITNRQNESRREDAKMAADEEYRAAVLALKGAAAGGGGGGGTAVPKPMSEYQAALLAQNEQRIAIQRAEADAKIKALEGKAAADSANSIAGGEEVGIAPATAYDSQAAADQAAVSEAAVDNYANGGMVRKRMAATGGLIEEDPDLPAVGAPPVASPRPMPRPTPQEAIPTQPAPVAPPMASSDANGVRPPSPTPKPVDKKAVKVVVAKASEAITAAMDAIEADMSTPQGAVGDDPERANIATGEGGLSPQEMDEVVKAVDPNGEIPQWMAGATKISEAYNYFMERGEIGKAVKVAKQMVVADKMLVQTLGTLSLRAVDSGDAQAACKLANDACSRFPDASEVVFSPDPEKGFSYVVKDGDKVVERGFMNKDQFYEEIGTIADGTAYIEKMKEMAAAGKKNPMAALAAETSKLQDLARASKEADMRALAAEEDGDPKALKDALAAAEGYRAQLEAATDHAMDVALDTYDGKGDRVAFMNNAQNMIYKALQVPDETPLPEPPEEGGGGFFGWGGGSDEPAPEAAIPEAAIPEATVPGGAPAPAPAPAAPTGPLLELSPEDVQKIRNQVAAGKSIDAIKAALTTAGYNTEGL